MTNNNKLAQNILTNKCINDNIWLLSVEVVETSSKTGGIK